MYESKTWKNRETEFPGRRRMTAVDGQEDVFDVTREEGLILEEGDAFDADTMNALEERVKSGFNNTCQYLYKATFLVDGWSGDGPYTQTVSVQAVDGGPVITSASHMTSGLFCDDTVQGDAQEALLEAAALVDKGKKTFGSGTITCVLENEKPEADAEVYFNVRKGGA